MALISPTLDDRTYAQLREELVRRIPVYDREWTDHNESDPGIALLELFAYLGESLLYRFNQIPDTTRIEFLRMLGVRPRPAEPARVLLAATTELPDGVQVLKGSVINAGSVPFETQDEVYIWPLEVVAAGKTPRASSGAPTENEVHALARANVAADSAQFYATTVVSADPLQPDAIAVDVSAQVDHALWIALIRKPSTDVAKLAGRVVFVGVAFDDTLEPDFQLVPLPGAAGQPTVRAPGERFHTDDLTDSPPPMLWRLWNGPVVRTAHRVAQERFQQLTVLADTTKGMVTDGVVKIELPATLPSLTGTATGGDDSPPPLNDAKLASRVVAWIQVSRPETPDIRDAIGTVRWVGLNTVEAVQARTAAAELLGFGTGDADQRYPLSHQPVLDRTVRLEVEEPGGWTPWQEVDTFAATGVADRHFTVDPNAGAVSFGRATVPQIGERIRVLGYRYGGGVIGNLPAGAVNAPVGVGGIKVSNPLKAVGGRDAVSLTDAMHAIPQEVHRRDRAVVPDDFSELSLQVNGVVRAECLSLLHPDHPAVETAGAVSVVVFPAEDLRDPDAPQPELGLLKRVAGYLDQRRLVTTELYVIPPEYRKISVSAGIVVKDTYQVDAVRRWVELILRQYLSPLPPFGPEGRGWPVGRAVRRAELEAVAVQVEGVEYLEGLLLGTIEGDSVVPRSLIPMARWQWPRLAEITVVAGAPLAPGTAYAPAPPAKIPVPLPPDVC